MKREELSQKRGRTGESEVGAKTAVKGLEEKYENGIFSGFQ